jgi:hypothetical protein
VIRSLLRRRARSALAAYAAARFVPRYGGPAGWAYNPATGLHDPVSAWSTGYLPIANEVLLTDQGSSAANGALFQTTVLNANTDAVRIRCAPVTTDWGTGHTIPNRARVGLGMVIEPASVKDNGFAIAEGGRVGSATTGLVPFRATSETVPVFFFEPGPVGKVRFLGSDVTWDATFAASLPNVGVAGGTPGINGFFSCYFADEATSDIVIDRCRVQGATGKRTLRGTRLHANRLAILGSYFQHFHDHTIDSQCVLIERNTRDVVIDNTYMAAAYGQALFIGGGTGALDATRAVTGVVVRRNTLDYPIAYRTNGWPTKALFESKGFEDALLEGNVLSGYFAGAGFEFGNIFHPVVLKSAHWRVRNVTLRANRLVNCSAFLNVQTEGDNNTAGASAGVSRLDVSHNAMLAPVVSMTGGYQWPVLLTDIANANLPAEFLQEWSLRENTIRHGFTGGANAAFMFDAIQSEAIGWNAENNIIAAEPSGTPDTYYNRPGGTALTAAVNYAAKPKSGSVWGGNVVVASGGAVIPGDIAVATVAALNLDASLRPTSGVALGKGADIDLIAAAIGSGGGAA